MAETSSLLRNHTYCAYRGFESLPLRHVFEYACVAQLDRVPGYEPGGRRFESFHTRHLSFSDVSMARAVDPRDREAG